jgi:hypothetical protein
MKEKLTMKLSLKEKFFSKECFQNSLVGSIIIFHLTSKVTWQENRGEVWKML